MNSRSIAIGFAVPILLGLPGYAAEELNTARIEAVTGLKGTWNAMERVFKVTRPRNDVPIRVDAWTMPPFMGLTSWAAFMPGGKAEAMVMGDLVLFEDEVNPVMSAALDGGLSVTALHNHFFFDEPKVFFVHIGGEGTVEQLATGVKAALTRVDEIRATQKQPAKSFGRAIPTPSTIDAAPLATILGAKPQARDGMAKFVIGRTARMECGCEVGAEMGVNTWAAFAGTPDDAIVDGDFAVLEDELQPVLKSLRTEGINIVAIHHHMTHETPRTLFLHYWGRGAAEALARSLKKTLEIQASVKPSVALP